METLIIRNPSLGGYSTELQEAILQGFRVSLAPSTYPYLDNQFNAVLSRNDAAVDTIGSENTVLESIANKSAGRPRRIVK